MKSPPQEEGMNQNATGYTPKLYTPGFDQLETVACGGLSIARFRKPDGTFVVATFKDQKPRMVSGSIKDPTIAKELMNTTWARMMNESGILKGALG